MFVLGQITMWIEQFIASHIIHRRHRADSAVICRSANSLPGFNVLRHHETLGLGIRHAAIGINSMTNKALKLTGISFHDRNGRRRNKLIGIFCPDEYAGTGEHGHHHNCSHLSAIHHHALSFFHWLFYSAKQQFRYHTS